MKKKTMRILSLIVAIIMVVSIIPLAALAEEVGPKRQVGVVVYGAELTTILTDLESTATSLKEGDVNVQGTLEKLNALVTDLGTKFVDGSGVSVPEVDMSITSKDGKHTYKLKENDQIELFSQTTEIYVPFQDDMEAELEKIQTKLEDLKVILTQYNLGGVVEGLDSYNDKFDEILANLSSVTTGIIANVAKLTGMNGMLYRTYVTEEAIPVGDYTVKVERFYDSDAEGNAITRDGYILYNDGLKEGGSGYNTFRTFDVTVEEKGMFDHDIQFVGPANGIQGSFDIPEPLNGIYNSVATTVNGLADNLENLIKKLNGTETESSGNWFTNLIGSAVNKITNLLADITKTQALLEWFQNWGDTPRLPTGDKLDLSYKFAFPGLWCAESDAGFAFTNVDVAEAGIAEDTFLLVNRQETIDVLKLMLDLGKEVFTGILKATFGYTNEETGEQYESMLTLYTQLVKNDEEGQLSLDYDVAYNIIKNYIAVISDMEIMDKIVDTDTGDLLTPVKLRYPIPAILQAVSDENGKVEFTKNSNITLTWMLDIIPQVTEALSKQDLIQDNQILNLLIQVADYAAGLIDEYGSKIINTLVYPFAQRLGLVGKKMASGEYIMFQTKTADDYWVNPLAYTMILTWENETWLYVTVADLGIIVPYFAEGWYDFVRNTTFAGTVDKFLSQLTGKEVSPITDILTDKVDVTKEMGKVLTGSLTAFVGTLGFDALGLDTIFANRSEFIEGINNYLYENGRTAQNLMIYVNRQAQRAKSVYAGYVTEDWYFYNLDKSPTLTATKLIDKSTKDISAAFVNPTASSIINRVGSGVSSVVNRIGTGIESVVNNIKTQIKSTIGAAIQNAVQKVLDSAKNTVTNFFKNLFNRGAITFNA